MAFGNGFAAADGDPRRSPQLAAVMTEGPNGWPLNRPLLRVQCEDATGGHHPAAPGHERYAGYRIVMGEYLESMGIAVRRGRPLRPTDTGGERLVAVVNQAFVRKFIGDEALGRWFHSMFAEQHCANCSGNEPAELQIVGIAEDVRGVAPGYRGRAQAMRRTLRLASEGSG